MDNRIITLLIAMGISPAALAIEPGADGTYCSPTQIAVQSLKLHFQTKLVIERLKELGALSITERDGQAYLVIEGNKLNDEFYSYLSNLKNVNEIPDSKELVISDDLAGALTRFGELKDLATSPRDEELLEGLEKKMGPNVDKDLRLHAGASFA